MKIQWFFLGVLLGAFDVVVQQAVHSKEIPFFVDPLFWGLFLLSSCLIVLFANFVEKNKKKESAEATNSEEEPLS